MDMPPMILGNAAMINAYKGVSDADGRYLPRCLHSAITWPKEIPQNQTQQRQEHHY
jgi:hypothetical protein